MTAPEDDRDRPAAWLEHHDGTWSMVDEFGIPGPPFRVVDGRAVPVDEDRLRHKRGTRS
ncbi:hypothetical protein AB0B25_04475 [Nocardia sp. NPDC049190]|uniref:hypothetical protein n=1 Tax=Nocardia sp. NPDC049190 TaxID=3155650 RepID=UPI00340BDB05